MDRLARIRRSVVLATLAVPTVSTVAYAASVVIPTRAPAGPDFAVGIAPADATGSPGALSSSSSVGGSSAKVTLVAGRHARLNVAFAPRNGFSGTVRLSARRVGGRLRTRLSRTTRSRSRSSSMLTIATSKAVRRGTFRVVLVARGAHGSRVVRATVTVRHLDVQPRLLTVTAGEQATLRVSLKRTTTHLSLSGLPAGATGVFSPNSTTGPLAALRIATDLDRTPAGTSTVTVTSRYGTSTSTARFRLRVRAPDRTPFGISGDVTGLAPGVTRALNLTLTNPYSYALMISDLRVAIAPVTAPGALPCTASDFAVSPYSGSYPLRLPARAARTLEQLGVSEALQPRVTMLNRRVNRDGCKSGTLTFAYGGSATR